MIVGIFLVFDSSLIMFVVIVSLVLLLLLDLVEMMVGTKVRIFLWDIFGI